MEIQLGETIVLIPLIVSILATLFYGINGIKRNQEIKNLLIQIGIINAIICFLGGLFWFTIAGDGLAQVAGALFYAGAFVFIEIVASLILYFISKK